MKKVVVCLMGILVSVAGFSQTWKEWFWQKKTRVDYMEKQVVALQAYIGVAQKGYGIYRDGLTFIGDLKQGDLDLHKSYFTSLSTVKPVIGQSSGVMETKNWQELSEAVCRKLVKWYSGQDENYVRAVTRQVIGLIQENETQLEHLTADGNYQLSDAHRTAQIHQVHREMQEYYQFVRAFDQEVRMNKLLRRKDVHDAKVLMSLYNDK